MGRFLLFVIVVGAVALYFTNPTTEDVQAKLSAGLPAELSALPGAPSAPAMPAAPDMPAPPAPADMPAPPPGMPAPPADMPTAPAAPDMAAPTVPGMPSVPTGAVQLERKDYYLFSVYKATVGGQALPGCLVGIAKQVVPMTPDRCPA